MLRRFFQQFQQNIAFLTQIFGQPNQAHLHVPLVGFQRHILDDVAQFLGGNIPLFVLRIQQLHPIFIIEIGILFDRLAPLGIHIRTLFHLTCLPGKRKRIMNIGVYQGRNFLATPAKATTIFIGSIATKDVLNVSQRQCHIPAAFRAQNQLRMRNSPHLHAVTHPLLEYILSNYICKSHSDGFNSLLRKITYKPTDANTTKIAMN